MTAASVLGDYHHLPFSLLGMLFYASMQAVYSCFTLLLIMIRCSRIILYFHHGKEQKKLEVSVRAGQAGRAPGTFDQPQ